MFHKKERVRVTTQNPPFLLIQENLRTASPEASRDLGLDLLMVLCPYLVRNRCRRSSFAAKNVGRKNWQRSSFPRRRHRDASPRASSSSPGAHNRQVWVGPFWGRFLLMFFFFLRNTVSFLKRKFSKFEFSDTFLEFFTLGLRSNRRGLSLDK